MLRTECYPLGELSANCYFVSSKEDGVSLVLDPGAPSRRLEEAIDRFGADKLQYILLTHGHFDHISGVAALHQKYPQAQIVLGKGDSDFPSEPRLHLGCHFDLSVEPFKADIPVQEGSVLPFGKRNIEVISTPGHTKGGVCYRIGDCLYTGDTLISGTTGRTDFPTGSMREMMQSMARLAAIPGDLKVYCGHGESSTLDYERTYNMYMRMHHDNNFD